MRIELCSDKHITLTTQVWIEWPVSYKLMPETPQFPQSKNSRYCFTQRKNLSTSAISSSVCGTGISTICPSGSGFHVHILRFQNPATEASSVHASQPRCNSHGFTPRNRTALNEGFSCLLQKVNRLSESPCLSDKRVVCVNSLILLVHSRFARSQDNVSV